MDPKEGSMRGMAEKLQEEEDEARKRRECKTIEKYVMVGDVAEMIAAIVMNENEGEEMTKK